MVEIIKKLKDICELNEYIPYLAYKRPSEKPLSEYTLSELSEENRNWTLENLVCGIDNLISKQNLHRIIYDVYDTYEDEKNEVKLFYLPSDKKASDKPFVVICAGGYYSYISNLNEAFPAAACLNRLGYDCFILNYRVSHDNEVVTALNDVSEAVRFIYENTSEFGSSERGYGIAGFSAGANLMSLFASQSKGYDAYGLEAPKFLFSIYPPTHSRFIPEPGWTMFAKIMHGSMISDERIEEYEVLNNIDTCYPKTVIVHSKADEVVGFENSAEYSRILDEKCIPHLFIIFEDMVHGFGPGLGTHAEGWIEKAVEFIES